MKKIFSVILLTAIIFFCGQNNFASAKDVYIESYSDGRYVYIVEETIDKSEYNIVKVTVKFIKNNKLDYIEHRIYAKVDETWWQSSEEAKRDGVRALRIWEPHKEKVLQYCLNY